MKRALLVGYFGKGNVGDDAFLAVNALYAQKLLGIDRALVTGPAPLQTYAVPNVPLHLWRNFTQFGLARLNTRIKARGVDHVIFGGGSIFRTEEAIKRCEGYLDLAGAGPHFGVGVSIGPFREAGAGAACRHFLRRLAFVGVRDRESLVRVQEIAPEANAHLTFDLGPLFAAHFRPDIAEPPAASRLGISLCSFQHSGDGRERERMLVDKVSAALRNGPLVRRLDEVILLDCNSNPANGDHAVHEELIRRLDRRIRVRHVPYENDPRAFLSEMQGLRALLAMRLHAGVFGYCLERPTVILGYQEKSFEWAKMIGQPSSLVLDARSLSADGISSAIECALESSCPKARLPVSEAVFASRLNWAWLDSSPRMGCMIQE